MKMDSLISLCSSCNHHASGDCVGLGRDGTYTWNTPVFPSKWENSSELDTVLNFIFPAEKGECDEYKQTAIRAIAFAVRKATDFTTDED